MRSRRQFHPLPFYASTLALCSIFIQPHFSSADTSQEIAKHQQEAVERKVDRQAIQRHVQRMVEQDGVSIADAWTRTGAGYALENNVEAAMFAMCEAVLLSDANSAARSNLGFFLANSTDRDDHQLARQLLEDAIAIHPDELAYHQNLGMLLLRLDDRKLALKHLQIASQDLASPHAAYAYAQTAHQSGDSANAAHSLRSSLLHHPDHEPSLELYHEITGELWTDPDLDELELRLLAYIDDTERMIEAYGNKLELILQKNPDTKGGTGLQVIERGKARLDIARSSIQTDLKNTAPQFANAMKAQTLKIAIYLTSGIRVQIMNGFYPYIHVWDNSTPQMHLAFSFVGGGSFLFDDSPYNQKLIRYYTARETAEQRVKEYRESVSAANYDAEVAKRIECDAVGAAAFSYVRSMPVLLNTTGQKLQTGLQQLGYMNQVCYDDYRSFMDVLDPYLAKLPQLANQPEDLIKRYCEGKDNAVGGLRYESERAIGAWQKFVSLHQSEIDGAWSRYVVPCDCGTREEIDDEFELTLQDLFEAWHNGGKYGTQFVVLDFGPLAFKVQSDGNVYVSTTPISVDAGGVGFQFGPSAEVYGDLFSDNWGVKLGTVAGGGAGVQVHHGAYLQFDTQSGLSVVTSRWEQAGGNLAVGSEQSLTSTPLFVIHAR